LGDAGSNYLQSLFASGGLQSLNLLGNGGAPSASLAGLPGGNLFGGGNSYRNPTPDLWLRQRRLPARLAPPPATYPALAGVPGLPGINGGLFGAGPGNPGLFRIY